MEHINSPTPMFILPSEVFNKSEFLLLREVSERMLCALSSVPNPIEQVLSKSGLLLRQHRSRMTDELLESLVFLKCN